MDREERTLRAGAAAICCALVLRLAAGGFFQPAAEFLARPEVSRWLLYLQTGLWADPAGETLPAFQRESPEPDFAHFALPEMTEPAAEPISFRAEDAAATQIKYSCSLRPDVERLLLAPLDWDLCGEEPTVLILHTHATESYTPTAGETYTQSAAFRTLDEGYNMISVGAYLKQLLEAGGIHALQDTALHDYPSYNGSYEDARKAVENYLAEYPSIRLVLDLHRDASGDIANQMKTSATVAGKPSAQLMLVMGTNASGQEHPNWQENLSLGLKLQAVLQQKYPGICRPLALRAQRFNQDLSPGALLIEVGAAGNTRREALTAVEALAEGILALAKGTTADSTPSADGTG